MGEDFFFFSSRRRHTRLQGDWSSDVCSSDLQTEDLTQAMNTLEDAIRKIDAETRELDRKSTRLNSSHLVISYAVFCLKKKKRKFNPEYPAVWTPAYDSRYHPHARLTGPLTA